MFLVSGLLALVMTMSMLCVVIVAGPLMVNVVGNIKDIVLTYVGFALFDD